MKFQRILFSVLICGAALAPSAFAATRTVQFVGTIISHTDRLIVNDYADFTACNVVVVNTGTTAQKVRSVTFYGFPQGGNLSAVPPTGTYIFNQGTAVNAPAACSPNCAGTDIDPAGGFFVATAYLDFPNVSGKNINLCSGVLEVEDTDPSRPGSVVAVGSISYLQEMAITGGQFNGALYFSGTHIDPGNPKVAGSNNQIFQNSSGAQPNNYTNFSGAWSNPEAMQMNLYCAEACFQAIPVGEAHRNTMGMNYCNALCGLHVEGNIQGDGHGQGENAPSGNGVAMARNSIGFLEETYGSSVLDAPTNLALNKGAMIKTYMAASSNSCLINGLQKYTGADPMSPNYLSGAQAEWYFPQRGNGDYATSVNEGPFFHKKTETPVTDGATYAGGGKANFRALMRTANPKYAGGHVMEMIVGPFDSICSGNADYFANGNTDFTHADTLDDDATMILASGTAPASGKGPPERLFCSHAHAKHSPYGYVASGVPFTINGGAAF